MINLTDYRQYWEQMVERVKELKSCEMISTETNMADKVQRIREEATPTLFFLPPSASSRGGLDNYRDENACVIFVMARYNPQRATSAATLEATQPILEEVKRMIIDDAAAPCSLLDLGEGGIEILPETDFFGNWAGWSMLFKSWSD